MRVEREDVGNESDGDILEKDEGLFMSIFDNIIEMIRRDVCGGKG